tara:strand:- start:64 stop:216 length:153 start_codon:yes stop_codon:yes gene_type:complete
MKDSFYFHDFGDMIKIPLSPFPICQPCGGAYYYRPSQDCMAAWNPLSPGN